LAWIKDEYPNVGIHFGFRLQKTTSLSFIARVRSSDLLGFVYSMGEPAGASNVEQSSTELFYRLQLSQGVAIIPPQCAVVNGFA